MISKNRWNWIATYDHDRIQLKREQNTIDVILGHVKYNIQQETNDAKLSINKCILRARFHGKYAIE